MCAADAAGLFRKKLKKSKKFFENREIFHKKSDYIGEGTFAPPCTARGGGGRGGFLSKSGSEFPFLVNAFDKVCLGMVKYPWGSVPYSNRKRPPKGSERVDPPRIVLEFLS